MVSLRRKLLYLLFVFLFFTITPITWLYAAGYTIGSGFKLQKTGALIIETEPEGAKIYLNDKPVYGLFDVFSRGDYRKTPAKLGNLTPGEYDVKLELDGYWSWQKKFTIKSNETAFAEDVLLFKKESPLPIASGSFTSLHLSPDMSQLAAFGKTNAFLVDTSSNGESDTYVSPSEFESNARIEWLSDDLVLAGNILFDKQSWTIPRDISKTIKSSSTKLALGRDADMDEILYIENGSLYSFSSGKGSKSLILPGRLTELASISGIAYALEPYSDKARLHKIDLDDIEKKTYFDIPRGSYVFLKGKYKYLVLRDIANGSIFIIDPEEDVAPVKEVIENANELVWIDNKEVSYSNDYEVWMLDLETKKRQLITRLSQPIRTLNWHPDNGHIIFSTDNAISVVELDDREKYNITKLIELKEIGDVLINKKGNELYFLGKIGDAMNAYKLSIN